jgi:hypothetical protein
MPLWFRIMRLWLPVAIATTIVVGFAYVAVQQSYRMGADSPQVQLAEDGAAHLDAGGAESDIVPAESVNVDRSLAPFVIVYDAKNAVIDGSGVLDGSSPVPPAGVLDAARSAGLNRVTWQPRPNVRVASVSVAAKDGRVVLAGRSLREVEARIDDLTKMAGAAWIIALLGTLAASAALEAFGRRWDPQAP